jgi:Putative Actinobacterial Holin-X, holin superfamily III
MTDTTLRTDNGRPGASDPTLGALFATASRDVSTLLRSEIELAKIEIKRDVSLGAKGGAMFAVAGVLGFLALILLLIAGAYGLVALGVPRALAFLIVAVVLLVIAGVLALVGKKAVGKVGPPERAIRTSKETAAFLKSPRSTDASPPNG